MRILSWFFYYNIWNYADLARLPASFLSRIRTRLSRKNDAGSRAYEDRLPIEFYNKHYISWLTSFLKSSPRSL